jgi:hypothetical protein
VDDYFWLFRSLSIMRTSPQRHSLPANPDVEQFLVAAVERARADLGDDLLKRPGKNRRPPDEAK